MPRLSASAWTQSGPSWLEAGPRSVAVAALIGCALTIVMTWPTASRLGTMGRFDNGDGRFSIWNVSWVAHAMLNDPLHVLDANIFHPHPRTLTYSELNLGAGVLALPAYAATRNPVAAHNSAVLIALFAAFLATWALVRRLTGSFAAGILAATGYTFSAYTAAHTAHIQLLMVFGFPLIMLAFHRLADRPSVAAGIALGGALAATALASGYYGVFAIPLIGLATLIWARRTARYWVAVAVAAATMAVLVLPVFVPFVNARAAARATSPSSAEQIARYSAHWLDYVTSAALVGGRVLAGIGGTVGPLVPTGTFQAPNEVLFPGFLIGGLAVIGVWLGLMDATRRRTTLGYLVIGSAALWASFGPSAGLYSVMTTAVPGISLLRAPVRLGVIVIFALAVLAGFALSRIRRPWVGVLCVGLLVVELWVPWPLRASSPEPRPYHMLRDLPRGGVIEFPFPYIRTDFHQHTRAMLRSTTNWQPLVNGYSDFTPDDFYEIAAPVNGFPDAASFEILRRRQVRYVLVRLGDYGQYRQTMLDRFPPFDRHLRLLADEGDVRLYEIVSWPEGMAR
jgi:hypothetical protein